jgi:hypothetical protein
MFVLWGSLPWLLVSCTVGPCGVNWLWSGAQPQTTGGAVVCAVAIQTNAVAGSDRMEISSTEVPH